MLRVILTGWYIVGAFLQDGHQFRFEAHAYTAG